MWKLSQYRRALFSFALLIAVALIIIFGLFSYFWVSSVVQNKVEAGNRLLLMQILRQMEDTFRALDASATRLINSSIIAKASQTLYDPANFQEFFDLWAEINRLHDLNWGYQSYYYVNYLKGWLLSDYGLEQLEESEVAQFLAPLIQRGDSTLWVGRVRTQNRYLCLVKKIPSHTMNPQGVFIVELPYTDIARHLSTVNHIGMLWVLDRDREFVIQEQTPDSGNVHILETLLKKELKKREGAIDSFTITASGKKFYVIVVPSTLLGWHFINILPYRIITTDVRALGIVTVIACTLLILLAILLAALGSGRLYNPIHQLSKVLQEHSALKGRDNKDEISYLGSCIEALLVERKELSETVSSFAEQARELFFLRLISNQISPEDIQSSLHLLETDPQMRRWMALLAIEIDRRSTEKRDEEVNTFLGLLAVGRSLREVLGPWAVLGPVLYQKYQVVLIGSSVENRDDAKRFALKSAELVREHLLYKLRITASIGVSSPINSLVDVGAAFDDAREALKYRLYFGEGLVSCLEDQSPMACRRNPEERLIKEYLLEAIKDCDRKRAHALVQDYIERVLSTRGNPVESQMALTGICLDILRMANDIVGTTDYNLNTMGNLLDKLASLGTRREIKEWWEQEVVIPAINRIEAHRRSRQTELANKVVALLSTDETAHLSLEECGTLLGYHPSYLSQVFQKEVGIGFAEYSGRIRLQLAKKWLAETDLTIAEIARRLRYNNPQNFIRYFRKLEGVTPGKYRKSFRTQTYGASEFRVGIN